MRHAFDVVVNEMWINVDKGIEDDVTISRLEQGRVGGLAVAVTEEHGLCPQSVMNKSNYAA